MKRHQLFFLLAYFFVISHSVIIIKLILTHLVTVSFVKVHTFLDIKAHFASVIVDSTSAMSIVCTTSPILLLSSSKTYSTCKLNFDFLTWIAPWPGSSSDLLAF